MADPDGTNPETGATDEVGELTLDALYDEATEDETEQTETESVTESTEEAESTTDDNAESAEAETRASEPDGEKPDEKDATDSTSESEAKEEPWHVTAVMAEREKRQKAEKRLEELEAKLNTEDKKDPTSVFEDEGTFRKELLTDVEQTSLNTLYNISQSLAEREFGKDVVAEKIDNFKALAKENPELHAEIRESSLPYHTMIDIVDRHAEAEKLKDPEAYKAQIEAEMRVKVRKELEEEAAQKAAEDAKKRDAISPSIASAQSKGGVKPETSLIGAEDVYTT